MPDIGVGLSTAQAWACKHREVKDEITYYVRDLAGTRLAMVTKDRLGVILTELTAAGRAT